MINLTEWSGPSHDILTEKPPWVKGVLAVLPNSIKLTFLPKKLDLRDDFGIWVLVEMTEEEASEVLGGVGDNETNGLLKLVCKVPSTREAIDNFSLRSVWIAGKRRKTWGFWKDLSLAREMDKDTSADGCSMLGFVWSPQDVDWIFRLMSPESFNLHVFSGYYDMGLWAQCVGAHISFPYAWTPDQVWSCSGLQFLLPRICDKNQKKKKRKDKEICWKLCWF